MCQPRSVGACSSPKKPLHSNSNEVFSHLFEERFLSYLLSPGMGILHQLGKKCTKLATPKNFYTGVTVPSEALPNNIILFHRDAQTLGRGQLDRQGHHHHRMVLILSFQGSGNIYLDSHGFRLSPGEGIAIFPFQFHAYSDISQPLNWLFITFEVPDSEGVLTALRNTGPRKLTPFDLTLVNEILDCWFSPTRQSLLAPHLGLLLQRLAGAKALPALQSKRAFSELLLKINNLALAQIGKQPFGIDDLARQLNTSESHLRARFREETGRSLGQHLRKLRLQKSCYLLRSTKLPITEVALRCGFDSVYSFSRAFKAAWGLPPKDYRKGKSPLLTES